MYHLVKKYREEEIPDRRISGSHSRQPNKVKSRTLSLKRVGKSDHLSWFRAGNEQNWYGHLCTKHQSRLSVEAVLADLSLLACWSTIVMVLDGLFTA